MSEIKICVTFSGLFTVTVTTVEKIQKFFINEQSVRAYLY